MYFVKLKGIPLAFEELRSLCNVYDVPIIKHYDGGVVVIGGSMPFERLTLSHYAARENDFSDNFETYRVVSLRGIETSLPVKLNGKVDLENPKNIVRAEQLPGKIIFGTEVWKFRGFKREYAAKDHVTMKPGLSRLLVNLAGVREGQTVYDPFCGTGSIPIEAALMGMRAICSDISEKMAASASENLRAHGIDCKAHQSDFFGTNETVDAIVTDLPYGRGTKNIFGPGFGEKFCAKLFSSLGKDGSAVVVFNREMDCGEKFLKKVFKVRVHKSLDRHIHILKKRNPAKIKKQHFSV